MLKKLEGVILDLAVNEFMISNNIYHNREIFKKAIAFGSEILIDLKKDEFDDMMEEMNQSYLNEKAIKDFEKHLEEEESE